jgi:hypothetical protein
VSRKVICIVFLQSNVIIQYNTDYNAINWINITGIIEMNRSFSPMIQRSWNHEVSKLKNMYSMDHDSITSGICTTKNHEVLESE